MTLPSPSLYASLGFIRTTWMAKLLAQYALSGLLNPHYLVSPGELPKGNPLRDPLRHWSSVAASRLDGRMKLLHGQERARAKALLGSANSFREKCAHFFEDAAADLAALNKLRVSTNVIAASIVHYAWD